MLSGKKALFVILFATAHMWVSAGGGAAQAMVSLAGTRGQSDEFHSAWLNLDPVQTFKDGDELVIRVAGSANNVLVRLLGRDMDPNHWEWLIGFDHASPTDRILRVVLDRDYTNVMQISLHGGANPWDLSPPFPPNNGNPVILSVSVVRAP